MPENSEKGILEVIEQQLNTDLENCFADFIMGKRLLIHLDKIEYLEKYIQDVMAVTPFSSPYKSRFANIANKYTLAREILQTNISHHEFE